MMSVQDARASARPPQILYLREPGRTCPIIRGCDDFISRITAPLE